VESFESVKSVGQALEEIEAETVINDPHPEIKRARIKLQEDERKNQEDLKTKELETRIRNEQKI
jgi:hypothetical protein